MLIFNRISYIDKMFFNLSVSWRWQLSLPKRALLFVRFEVQICNWTSYINKMFSNLSVSYRWQLSLPKRALLFVRFEVQTCNWTSYINKMFSISQSAALTALFTKESLWCVALVVFNWFNWHINAEYIKFTLKLLIYRKIYYTIYANKYSYIIKIENPCWWSVGFLQRRVNGWIKE